ncbi:MAG: type II toxin-antitoxin system prevent-host-death family antitoxin [Phycisphaeraceae bacterium]|nr:type II toxin-antitoxin system prevent-host-death family antitoxin [Phycisphaeraceae bacterium]
MIRVNAREARERFSSLLTEAEKGQTVAITRRGRMVAQLIPPPPRQVGRFPDLTAFRNSIRVKPGAPAGADLIRKMRDEERS